MEPLSATREQPCYRVLRQVILNHVHIHTLTWGDVADALTATLWQAVKQGLERTRTPHILVEATTQTLARWTHEAPVAPLLPWDDLDGDLARATVLHQALLDVFADYGDAQGFNPYQGIRVTLRLLGDLVATPDLDAATRAEVLQELDNTWRRYLP